MRGLKQDFPLDLSGVTVGVSALALLFGGVRAFYFEGGFLESFSYYSDERTFNEIANGWVGRDPAETLVGIHAFGDYVLPNVWASFPDPWGQLEQVNYLPPMLLLFRVLGYLPYSWGFSIYFVTLIACTLAPMVIASRGFSVPVRVLLVTTLALLTGPALATFDRGNSQGFLPIILFGFAIAVLKQRWGWAAVLIALAATIKIYPIVLVLLLIALRKYRWSVLAIGLTVVAVLITLPIMSSAGFGGLGSVIGDVLQFQERTIEDFLQYNITLVGGLANLAFFMGAVDIGTWISTHALIVIALYGICVIPILWMRSIEVWIRIVLVLSLTTAMMPIIYPYSLNWVLASSALAVWVAQRKDVTEIQRKSVSATLILALAAGSAVLPVLIPGSMEAGRPAGIVSFAALMVAFLVPITALASGRGKGALSMTLRAPKE